jgi:uncharacterized OB-fold protein
VIPPELRPWPGSGDPAELLPPRTRQNAPFFDALAAGELRLQACGACDRVRWPIAPVCPHCGVRAFAWRTLSGAGRVHSWVRFRRSYLPQFEPLMPYDVLCVALVEGPRIFGRLAEPAEPWMGMPVRTVVERLPGGECLPAFVATG